MPSNDQVIRILSVVERLSVGGIEDSLLMLCNDIDRARFQMEVCTLYSRGPLADEFEAIGVPVHNLALDHRRYLINAFRIARLLRRRRFDIVHLQVAGPGLATRLATRLTDIPALILSIQNTYFQRTWLECNLDRWLACLTDEIVANSYTVKDFTAEREHINSNRFKVIYSAVDIVKFDPSCADGAKVRRELGISPTSMVVGMAASLTEKKGHTYLLQAAADILRQWPEVIFLLVGDGPLKARLQEQAVQAGVTGCTIFSPSRRDLPDTLAAMDIFVTPSLREGFSLVILDAMAMQKAIVASDISSISEAIVDNECGLLFSPCDPEALADKIDSLLGSPEMRARLGEATRRRVVELFSVDVFVKRWEELYESLIPRQVEEATPTGTVGVSERTRE